MSDAIRDYNDVHHVGPGTLAGDYLRSFWHPVHVARDLRSGRAVPLKILHEEFTLYRGEAGQVHAVAFRCAHRGTQLSTGWVEGDCIRCFYHGWKYDASGQCVEQPAEDAGFAAKVRIRSYPVREYLGLIFAYLGPGEPPPLPRYGELEAEGTLQLGMYLRPCSYFNNAENGIDEVHVHFVHRQAFTGLQYDIPKVWAEETDHGLVQYGQRRDGAVRESHWLMPNALLFKSGDLDDDADQISWRVPVDDVSHKNFMAVLHHRPTASSVEDTQAPRASAAAESRPSALEVAQAILRGEMQLSDLTARDDLITIQDHVAQLGQGAMADFEHEHLGQSDRAVILLRKIWARELKALAEGSPLKQWRKPDVLTGTTGVPLERV